MKLPKMFRLFGIMGLVCLVALSMISAASAQPDVCRDLPATVAPGDTITVNLDITLDGADKTVIEDNVPVGWTVSNPTDGGFVVDDNTVGWLNPGAAPGDTQFSYDVTIPGDAAPGLYDFAGEFDLAVAAPGLQPIDCDTQVEIVEDGNGAGEPNVCRDLPLTAAPGDTITVNLDITLDGADKTVIEDNVPAGWTVSNPTDGGFVVDDNTVAWVNPGAAPGDAQVSYDVTIPEDAAISCYDFAGEFDLSTAAPGLQPIDCETQLCLEEEAVEPVCDGVVLNPGMTLISTPFALNNSSVEYVFMDVNTTDLLIGQWNCSAQMWEGVTEMVPLRGYAVWNCGEEAQCIPFDAFEPSTCEFVPLPTLEICEGYNLIGLAETTPAPAQFALSSIDESWDTIKAWDTEAGWIGMIGHNGETGDLGGNHVGEDVFTMEPYAGYFLVATQNDTLYV